MSLAIVNRKLCLLPDRSPKTSTAGAVTAHKRFGEDPEYQPLFRQLATDYQSLRLDPSYLAELDRELILSSGRPSSLFHARRLSEQLGGARIFIKREDLMPAGSTLMTAITGQALCARRLGRKCLVTASHNGHKGVVTAAIAARLGLDAVIYLDSSDEHLNEANIFRMRLYGASVKIVKVTSQDGGDVRELALRHWLEQPGSSFLVMGLDDAPEPYRTLTMDAVAVVGREVRFQVRFAAKRSPDLLVARAGNNADALGFFSPFMQQSEPRLVCVDCVGELQEQQTFGRENVYDPIRGELSSQQKRLAGAILDGLEYPSVDREQRALRQSGRIEYVNGSAPQALHAIQQLSRLEGLTPAVQTAQVLAWAAEAAAKLSPDQVVVINMVEQVDKDIWDIRRALNDKLPEATSSAMRRPLR